MQDIHTRLAALQRPRLMMRAARIGARDYRRLAHLPRLLGYGVLPRHTEALLRLLDMEAEQENLRAAADAGHSLMRQIDLLIAIVGEARDLRAAQGSLQTVGIT